MKTNPFDVAVSSPVALHILECTCRKQVFSIDDSLLTVAISATISVRSLMLQLFR